MIELTWGILRYERPRTHRRFEVGHPLILSLQRRQIVYHSYYPTFARGT